MRPAAHLAALLILAASPVAALGSDTVGSVAGHALAMDAAASPGEPADRLTVEAAGQQVAVPLPVALPLTTAVDLPLADVDASRDDEGEPAATSTSPARRGGSLEDAVQDVPAPVAWGGSGLLLLASGIGAFALFSRIQGPAVLEHPTRARIMELVAQKPGITLLALQGEVGIAWGTLTHHVRRLERNDLVAAVRQGPRLLLYAANTPQARARNDLALLHNETARRVARMVSERPGIRTGMLSQALGIRAPSACKHLGKFAAAGLVQRAPDGFQATDRLRQALALA